MVRSSTSFRVVVKPILPVIAMEDAVSFYRQLGFDTEPYGDGYSIVSNSGDETLHLRVVEDLVRHGILLPSTSTSRMLTPSPLIGPGKA